MRPRAARARESMVRSEAKGHRRGRGGVRLRLWCCAGRDSKRQSASSRGSEALRASGSRWRRRRRLGLWRCSPQIRRQPFINDQLESWNASSSISGLSLIKRRDLPLSSLRRNPSRPRANRLIVQLFDHRLRRAVEVGDTALARRVLSSSRDLRRGVELGVEQLKRGPDRLPVVLARGVA